MKTLHLPLKAKWYDMIESGVKTEEYREIKPYWSKRLECQAHFGCGKNPCKSNCVLNFTCNRHTHVRFSYGYTKRTMTFEIEGITIGYGRTEWGAPADKEVFIIKLGERL